MSSKTSGNSCNNLANMVGYNPRQKMVALAGVSVDSSGPLHYKLEGFEFEETIKQAIAQQRLDLPLNLLTNQVEADAQFKFRANRYNQLVPDIDVQVALPCAPSGVEAAIFCKNALSYRKKIIGFDIDKMNGKYPMSLRCQGDEVKVSVFTPLGINFVLSKSLTADDGWHFRLEGCKSLGNSHFIMKRCLMHCAADYQSSLYGKKYEKKTRGHTVQLECDVGFKVFENLTLWNTNNFVPICDEDGVQPFNGWKSQFQVETQDLLSCKKVADLMRSASSKSSEDMTCEDMTCEE